MDDTERETYRRELDARLRELDASDFNVVADWLGWLGSKLPDRLSESGEAIDTRPPEDWLSDEKRKATWITWVKFLSVSKNDSLILRELWANVDPDSEFLYELGKFYLAYEERAKTEEREAYRKALMALCEIVDTAARTRGDDYYKEESFRWVFQLVSMLKDLDSGVVSPVFNCAFRSNALPSNVWNERVWAVLAVEAFHLLRIPYSAAAKKVLEAMPGFLDGASEEDVLSWRAEFKKDKVKNRSARNTYRAEMAELRSGEFTAAEIVESFLEGISEARRLGSFPPFTD